MKRKPILLGKIRWKTAIKALSVLSLLLWGYTGQCQTSEIDRRIDSLEVVLKQLPQDTNRVNTLIDLCYHLLASRSEEMPRHIAEAIRLSEELEYKLGQARSYNLSGTYNGIQGNSTKAIELQLKSLDIYTKLDDQFWIAGLNNNIGLVFLSQDQTTEARTYFQKALDIWSLPEMDKVANAKVLRNIAITYEKEQNDSLALEYFNKSIVISEEVEDKLGLSHAWSHLGGMYLRRGDLDSAILYQSKALRPATEVGSAFMEACIYAKMSEIYISMQQPSQALESAKKSLEKALESSSTEQIAESYKWMAKSYENIADYSQAYNFQTLYMTLNDSLKSAEKMKAIENIRSSYHLEKKEAAISQLRNEKRVLRNTFIGISIAVIIIIILIYSRQKVIAQKKSALRKQQLNFYAQKLKEKNDILIKINAELDVFKEQHNAIESEMIEKLDKVLQFNIHTCEDWEDFKEAFEEVYPSFFTKLRFHCPDLTESELRMAALAKLRLSVKESATMLAISAESVRKARYRLRKKLSEKNNVDDIESFIDELS